MMMNWPRSYSHSLQTDMVTQKPTWWSLSWTVTDFSDPKEQDDFLPNRIMRKPVQRKSLLCTLRGVLLTACVFTQCAANALAPAWVPLQENEFERVYELLDQPTQRVREVMVIRLFGPKQIHPSVAEFLAGNYGVSKYFAGLGGWCLEGRDIKLGHNLRDAEERLSFHRDVERENPDIVVTGFPCTLWRSLAEYNYHRSEEGRQRLAELRDKEEEFLVLCRTVADLQVQRGKPFLIENRKTPRAWHRSPMATLAECD